MPPVNQLKFSTRHLAILLMAESRYEKGEGLSPGTISMTMVDALPDMVGGAERMSELLENSLLMNQLRDGHLSNQYEITHAGLKVLDRWRSGSVRVVDAAGKAVAFTPVSQEDGQSEETLEREYAAMRAPRPRTATGRKSATGSRSSASSVSPARPAASRPRSNTSQGAGRPPAPSSRPPRNQLRNELGDQGEAPERELVDAPLTRETAATSRSKARRPRR